MSLNSAFSALRSRIPKVPADTKLSKIKTLRLASLYIQHLNKVLSAPADVTQQPKEFEIDWHLFKRSRCSTRRAVAAAAAAVASAGVSGSGYDLRE